jgi:hypothetical protein
MNKDNKDDRIRALRQDPDFRALVNALESQTTEQVDSFYSQYESEEDTGAEDDAQ